MTLALHERGLFTWPEWAATLADEIKRAQAAGDPDTGETYYRHWLNALERLVAEKGVDRCRRRSRATSTPGTTPPTARRTASRSNCGRKTSIITTNPHRRSRMTTATVGAAKITRIEESYEPNFEATHLLRRLARRDRRRASALDGAEPLRSGDRMDQAQRALLADRDRRAHDPDRHLHRQSQGSRRCGRSGTSSTRPTWSASRRPASGRSRSTW